MIIVARAVPQLEALGRIQTVQCINVRLASAILKMGGGMGPCKRFTLGNPMLKDLPRGGDDPMLADYLLAMMGGNKSLGWGHPPWDPMWSILNIIPGLYLYPM